MKSLIPTILLIISFPILSISQVYHQVQKIVASERASADVFGLSVAISGNYAIVGAQYESQDTMGLNALVYAGAAYIFERDNNGNWNQKQKIVPSDRTTNDYFGASVAISGNQVIVGAYEKNGIDGTTYPHAGAAYIFKRGSNGHWNQTGKLLAADTGSYNHFGYTVSISGRHAIVGVPIDMKDATGVNDLNSAGSAYVFEQDGNGNWSTSQKITSSDRATADLFGAAVAISGNYAIVGAYQQDRDSLNVDSLADAGAVYVFQRDGFGIWNQKQKIVSSDRTAGDRFGIAVSIDSSYIIAGAYLQDVDINEYNFKSNAGAAYIFERNGNNDWIQTKKLLPADRAINDNFGATVSINGNYAMVGVQNKSTDASGNNFLSGAGAAYIYKRAGNGTWSPLQKIVASDRAVGDAFGGSVCISDSSAFSGAYLQDEDVNGANPLNGAGAAYIYKACHSTSSTINKTVCNSYTSPSGHHTWISTGIYNDTIPNALGCDSIITIHLMINSSSSAFSRTVCSSYTSPSGHYIWTSTGIYKDTIPNSKNCDSSMTISLAVNNSSSAISPMACHSYTSPSGKYTWTSSNTYNDTIPNHAGCDSIITIHLTISTGSTSATLNTTACITYVSPSGKYTWTSPGTYMDTIPNRGGCDSIMTIHLTIHTVSTSSTISRTVCNSYTSPSGHHIWTSSNTYLDTIPNTAGCDSIIAIHLTVNSTHSSIYSVACRSYVSPSGRYTWTQSNTYMDTIPNSISCDSIITIHLLIQNSHSTINPTVCNNYTSPSGHYIWTSSNTYQDTIPNFSGCDSIITIHLLVNNSGSVINETACNSYTSPSGNYILTSSGTYMDTIPNTAGCDSVLTIHLTINILAAAINQSGNTLNASTSGGFYQWLHCTNGNFITINGATNQHYTATASGDYAVVITKNSCRDTSACYTFTDVGVTENKIENEILVFPNPADALLNVSYSLMSNENIFIELTNSIGQIIYSYAVKDAALGKHNLQINTSEFPVGLYILSARTGEQKYFQRVALIK
jgi:hypothetical protein